jgi:hypothetical protein
VNNFFGLLLINSLFCIPQPFVSTIAIDDDKNKFTTHKVELARNGNFFRILVDDKHVRVYIFNNMFA